MIFAWACIPEFTAPRPCPAPQVTLGPLIQPPSSTDVALVKMLSVSTDGPSRLTVLLEGADTRLEIVFPELSTQHTVPLLGLVEFTPYTATVTLASDCGAPFEAEPVGFNSGMPLAPAPVRTLLVHDADRSEPGYTIYPAEAPSLDIVQLEAVDASGRLVWQYRPPLARSIAAVQFHTADGTVSALLGGRTIHRFDLADTRATSWTPVADAIGGDIPVDVSGFHHEAAFEPDGSFWTLRKQNVPVDDYPLDHDDPSVTGPAVLDADVVVHVAEDGTVLGEWLLTEYLDPHRIGYDATDVVGAGEDRAWSHANAVLPFGDDHETFIVSSRHQDAVVKIRGDANEAEWILANHDGWADEYRPLLLDQLQPFLWFTHQHAPAFDADGRLLLFDNGNWSHSNPYQDEYPGETVSRLVRYDIDEAAGTVAESFAFVADATIDPLFSSLLGNADAMPVTGNVLGTFAYLRQEMGVVNVNAGLGDQSIRIIEVDPTDGTVVWDLRLNSQVTISPLGWQGDRAIRVSSLYASDVSVRWLE